MKYLTAIAALTLAALFFACGDDSDSNDPNDQSPTATTTVEPARRAEILDFIRSYLSETGIDGRTGALTDPMECAELGDDPEGDFCIVEPSVYAPGLGLVLVGDASDHENEVWQVRMVFEDDEWEVIETVKLEDEID